MTGRFHDMTRPHQTQLGEGNLRFDGKFTPWSSDFTPVPAHAYVDGVLVPNAAAGDCIVSSRGHVFKECPQTNGQCKLNVINGWRHRLDSSNFGHGDLHLAQRSGITLHANCAITFDLKALQRDIGNLHTARFRSELHVPKRKWSKPCDMDIWVLLDGEVCFARHSARQGLVLPMDVAIRPGQRFLTLVATDGFPSGIQSDRCFFADAVIEFASSSK